MSDDILVTCMWCNHVLPMASFDGHRLSCPSSPCQNMLLMPSLGGRSASCPSAPSFSWNKRGLRRSFSGDLSVSTTDTDKTRKRDNLRKRRSSRKQRSHMSLRALPSKQTQQTLDPIIEVAEEANDDRRVVLLRTMSDPEIMVPVRLQEQGLKRVLSLDQEGIQEQGRIPKQQQGPQQGMTSTRNNVLPSDACGPERQKGAEDEDSLMDMTASTKSTESPTTTQDLMSEDSYRTGTSREGSNLRYD